MGKENDSEGLGSNMILGALPMAIELVAATLIFIGTGYFLGGLISDTVRVIGMSVGAMLGLVFFVYRTKQHFKES